MAKKQKRGENKSGKIITQTIKTNYRRKNNFVGNKGEYDKNIKDRVFLTGPQ